MSGAPRRATILSQMMKIKSGADPDHGAMITINLLHLCLKNHLDFATPSAALFEVSAPDVAD